MKLLVKLPSRGRPQRFFRALDSIVANIDDHDNYHISCTLDTDDNSMNNEEVIAAIKEYPNASIEWGTSDSKIHAVNRSMPTYEWDILVVGSDDIFFNVYGFDEMIRQEMKSTFPEGDGYLHFMESDTKELLNVMTVVDRKYYDRFGYIYHPSYKSLWCDNEQMLVAQKVGRYKYINYSIMEHLNPAYGKLERDTMFNEQQAHWNNDEHNFYHRQSLNFNL